MMVSDYQSQISGMDVKSKSLLTRYNLGNAGKNRLKSLAIKFCSVKSNDRNLTRTFTGKQLGASSHHSSAMDLLEEIAHNTAMAKPQTHGLENK